ncbi:MAG: DUF4118 domain-containing protein [Gemmatimonadales bacterium]
MMPAPGRPDPDALLAQVQRDAADRARGRLKIFFGATAGVGKTYAMLEEAHRRREEGIDVVAGVVETHGRRETEALLEGFEVLPRRRVEYRNVRLAEFDLDGALARHPGLLLVDELAHTNAPGSRHAKRWQDVEELLDARIDVYATVNVQHVESLNDVVARITHVQVRETVPDAVLEEADEIELIDLPPEELLQRLAEGKVYIAPQARRATEHFFRKGNLIALRQLALRMAADRVEAQVRTYRRAHGVAEIWPVTDRILVAVGPTPGAASLVRAAKRMADRLAADWTVLFVETPDVAHWPAATRARVWETLRLADTLGASTVTITGTDTGREVLNYARTNNVSRIVLGKPHRSRWRELLVGSRIDRVIRESGEMDVHLIAGTPEDAPPGPARPAAPREQTPWPVYARVVGIMVLLTVVAVALRERVSPANLVMLYQVGVLVVAVRHGRGPAVLAAFLSVAAFDWFTVPPYNTFAVADTEYLLTFAVMLGVALTISGLAVRLREQVLRSRAREHRTAALYELSRDLIETTDLDQVLAIASRQLRAVFGLDPLILLPDAAGRLVPWQGTAVAAPIVSPQELRVAQWVFDHDERAGTGTATLPAATGFYLPLSAPTGTVGVFGALGVGPDRFRDPEQVHLLETFLHRVAGAVERSRLAAEGRRARELREMDRLKAEFVAAASHELRAPLASLERALERLHGTAPESPVAAATEEIARLNRLVDDLFDLARLEADRVGMEPVEIDLATFLRDGIDRLGSARIGAVTIALDLPDRLPTIAADRDRLARVLDTLLRNALGRVDGAGRVVVSADGFGRFVQVSVADDGAGIAIEDQARVFDRFVPRPDGGVGGGGLGLPIAREIVRTHGGAIWVDSGPGPGAVFSFTVPVATADEMEDGE